MPHTDLPLDLLRDYRPDVAEPADFDEFWTTTLAEARALSTAPVLDAVAGPFTEVAITDLTFAGFGGEPVRAWITRPHADEPRPAVIEFLGYNGGRGLPGERLHWANAGYVHVLMDTRGQGSGWGSGGDTADPHGSGPAFAGFLTRGIEDPQSYYYRRVFTDAVLLADVVSALPFVDASRIAVTGGSQGGGISLAAAALSPAVHAVLPDVPFLCHFRRSAELTPSAPFTELREYLGVHRGAEERVFTTLSYFDGVNFARRIRAAALFSVALMDEVVLPSSVFAAFNHCAAADREIAVYAFNGHEGGELHHWYRQHAWLAERFRSEPAQASR
ncbi:MAG: acetylxylan esterase [Schumannella sp.]|nr:acetylxylan esterase [Schumannella sp.]